MIFNKLSLKLALGSPLILALLYCILIIASNQRCVAASAQDVDYSNKNDQEQPITVASSSSSSSNSDDLMISDLSLEEDNDGQDADEDDATTNLNEHRKFTYDVHPEDHGVYAGRALSSTHNIKTTSSEASEDEEDQDVDNEVSSAKSGNSKLNNNHADEELSPMETIDYAEKEWQLMLRSFDFAYDTAAGSILHEIGKRTNLFEEIVGRLPPACKRDINHLKESALKHRLWALRMLDSNGKIPSGVTYGRFTSPGDYEECLSTRVDELIYKIKKISGHNNDNRTEPVLEAHKFHGKYCLIDFRLPMPEKPQDKMLSIHDSALNFTGTELEKQFPEFVRNYSAYASVFYEVGYMHAFCLPSTCQVEDLTKSIGKSLEPLYLIVNNTVDCEEWPEQGEPLRTSQIISLLLMILVFSNAFLASLAYQLLPNKNGHQPQRKQLQQQQQLQMQKGENSSQMSGDKMNSRGFMAWLVDLSQRHQFYASCFSIQKNFERLSKPDPRGLTFVHYTRIVAMGLTVITHTGALGTLQAITKPADAGNSEQIFRDFLPQMLANCFTSIQIFFFMAGFMLVVSTYPSIRRDKGQMSFLEYAVKRAIRLMPGLAATICLNFLWPLIVEGPMLKYFIRMIVIPCETTWWHTMGFMSNFDNAEKMCLRHSYFSASDYQLHIIAFPLLILLYKQPMLSMFLAGLLTICGFVAQTIMTLTKKVLPFMMVDYLDKDAFMNVVHYTHHPSWNHMSAFFYGFMIGYLVVRQIRINLSPITVGRIWYTLMPIGILSIFAPYYWNHYKRPIYRWQMVLYLIIDRFILLTTCAWLSYASMVLSRPSPKKSQQQQQQQSIEATRASNKESTTTTTALSQLPPVPVIVETPPSPTLSKLSAIEMPGTPESQQKSTAGSLRPSLPAASLPRQRSSPSLLNELEMQNEVYNGGSVGGNYKLSGSLSRLNRTISGSNLTPIAEATEKPAPGKTSGALSNVELNSAQLGHQTNKPVDLLAGSVAITKTTLASNQTAARPKKNHAPISNVNTLCLILSRLTFQLYLFNMVVLWVDVNHSKYYWFFSYWFIIIKAAAVYIASAVMAMIFFVVLESPCLTLYIAWVRGRAAARAKARGASPLPEGENQTISERL